MLFQGNSRSEGRPPVNVGDVHGEQGGDVHGEQDGPQPIKVSQCRSFRLSGSSRSQVLFAA